MSLSRLTQTFSRVGRDGLTLSRALYGAVPRGSSATTSTVAERIKSVLLEEARKEPIPNTLAVSFLKIDKEVGLVRYWGLAEYLRQNQHSFSFASLSSSSSKTTQSSLGNNNSGAASGDDAASLVASQGQASGAARVAFMITSSMKRDLVDGLGYQASVIKTMTPQQASLVLHHRLSSDNYETRMPELEKTFAEEQENLKAFVEEQRKKQDEQQLQQEIRDSETTTAAEAMEVHPKESANLGTSSAIADKVTSHSDFSIRSPGNYAGDSNSDGGDGTKLMLSSSSSDNSSQSSPPPTLSPSTEDVDSSFATRMPSVPQNKSDDDIWYEVVETMARDDSETTTEDVRHGLYKDREEALLSLEVRQDIRRKREEQEARKNTKDDAVTERTRFVMRPISFNDLQ